ncbi:HhH-GPD-type base excision DNA repair protein [Geodermatophilus maliterrae]|uniref:HhH-GPD-type base excision DNA repair protein n=1 Tax=Geodermatophilus maliterrae TaxID=3162531 RepID=A0ABV3XHF3_9ACTN
MPTLRLTQDDAADDLLGRDPLALVLGMLFDQQFPMERAFAGPRLLADRMGVDSLSAAAIADADPDALLAWFQGPPAVHRYPGSMAARTQALCRLLLERYDGRAERLWDGVPDGATLLRRIGELPGFGAQKAKILVALLGKQYGVTPPGWREAAGSYGEEGSRRSVADITGPESLAEVRAAKQEAKAVARAAGEKAAEKAAEKAPGRAARAR